MNFKDIARMSKVILIKLKVLFSLADIHASDSNNEQCIFFQRVGNFKVTLSVYMCICVEFTETSIKTIGYVQD